MREIEQELLEWSPTLHETMIYEEWIEHEKYPFAGGMLDQPQWFFELRRKYGLLDEYYRLKKTLPDKLPGSFDD
jgi:hypothetical protein